MKAWVSVGREHALHTGQEMDDAAKMLPGSDVRAQGTVRPGDRPI